MIPTLYERTETEYVSNGLGRLADAISCVVTEERNAAYELVMEYPITGVHYEDLAEERIILAEPSQGSRTQPFRIYRINRQDDGIVTVYAEHISYLLNRIVVNPYTANSCLEALIGIKQNAINECPFSFYTDKTTTGSFNLKIPKEARTVMGGDYGSILRRYGTGDYEFDRFNVTLHVNRGTNNGVTIRYGKNITELIRNTNIGNCYTGIVPYWQSDEESVILPERVIYSEHRTDFTYDIIKTVDLSDEWSEPPTVEQLRTRAEQYVRNNEGWVMNDNITVSFVPLWQTEEYKDIAALERVHLCDTVTILYEPLNIAATARVVKTEYDVLRERYISIDIGNARNSLADVIAGTIREEIQNAQATAINTIGYQTDLIRGGLGGYMVINTDDDGKPTEILFMNTDDVNTATQVLRINMNGIGFGSSYEGPFDTAWTLDGVFNASYIQSGIINASLIQAGVLDANVIRAGIIRDLAGKNWWNLDTGEIQISAEAVVDTSEFVTQAQFTAAADRIATEVVEQVGSGIFFNVVPTDNGNGTVTLQAHVFLNRNDATQSFSPYYFQWYKKTEDGKDFIGYGYEITVTKSEYGYGGEVEATFLMLQDRYAVNSQGKWIFTVSGTFFTLVASQGTLLFSQGYPLVLSDAQESSDAYAVFGYDYYE